MIKQRVSSGLRLAAAGLVLCVGMARASGLQVAPIALTLRAEQHADGLWLSNTGDAPLHAQIRVFHWSQADGSDRLTASRDLAISPPMVRLAPGQRQLVRIIRSSAPPQTREDSYRVLVDELPVAEDGRASNGLQFVLSYSVPVFIAPREPAVAAPKLDARLVLQGTRAELWVGNQGASHARIAQLSYVDATGRRNLLVPGLLGYALPGQRMHWTLQAVPALFKRGGSLRARINDDAAERTLAPVSASP